jgi:hypothetical protein
VASQRVAARWERIRIVKRTNMDAISSNTRHSGRRGGGEVEREVSVETLARALKLMEALSDQLAAIEFLSPYFSLPFLFHISAGENRRYSSQAVTMHRAHFHDAFSFIGPALVCSRRKIQTCCRLKLLLYQVTR